MLCFELMKGVKRANSHLPRRFSSSQSLLVLAIVSVAAFSVAGCSSSKFAGEWKGLLKESATKPKKKAGGYSETKPILTSSMTLSGDGTYTAKFREVDYTGEWKDAGGKITLTPKTYMGMPKENFPKTKQDAGAGAVDSLYKPYELDESSDGKTLTHTDEAGTNTFTKNG